MIVVGKVEVPLGFKTLYRALNRNIPLLFFLIDKQAKGRKHTGSIQIAPKKRGGGGGGVGVVERREHTNPSFRW